MRRIELATEHLGIENARAEVEPLLELGLSVSITYPYVRSIADFIPLLALATAKASVTLRSIDVHFVATRAPAGLVLDLVSRDPRLVEAALSACRGATVSIQRPRGAKLFGPDGQTRRLANFLQNNNDWRVTLDSSWTEMLRR